VRPRGKFREIAIENRGGAGRFAQLGRRNDQIRLSCAEPRIGPLKAGIAAAAAITSQINLCRNS
jgi:hypothetical protein